MRFRGLKRRRRDCVSSKHAQPLPHPAALKTKGFEVEKRCEGCMWAADNVAVKTTFRFHVRKGGIMK